MNKNILHISLLLLASSIFLLFEACVPKPDQETVSITQRIEDPYTTNRLSIASYEHVARWIVAESPDVKALITKGDETAKYLSFKFGDKDLTNRDYALAHYAYVIENVGYRKALPKLNKFLSDPANRAELHWAIVFAENAREQLEKGTSSP